jgi:hypothetical protein
MVDSLQAGELHRLASQKEAGPGHSGTAAGVPTAHPASHPPSHRAHRARPGRPALLSRGTRRPVRRGSCAARPGLALDRPSPSGPSPRALSGRKFTVRRHK